jgi:hypothetical protein
MAHGPPQNRHWRGPRGGKGGVGARSRGGGVWPDSGVGRLRGGSGKAARQHDEVATRLGPFRGKVAHRRRLSTAATTVGEVVNGGGPSVRSAWRRRREVRRGGQPRRRTGAAALTGVEAVKHGGMAPVAWRAQTRAVGSGTGA